MPGSCAACEVPFEKGERFVVSGTEVFHRACAKNIERSVLTRTRQQVIQQMTIANHHRDKRESLSRDLVRLGEDYMAQKHQLEDARRVERNLVAMTEIANVRHGQVETLTAENERLRAEMVRITAENQRMSQQLLTIAIERLPATSDPPATKVSLDDAEIRFSLLEIDSS